MGLLEAGSCATSVTTFAATSEHNQKKGQICAAGSGQVFSVGLG